MTHDTGRVLAALEATMGAEVTVCRAWPETRAVCPAAVVMPAEVYTVCQADGEALLTGIVQPLHLTARSQARLEALMARAEEALRGLGYRLTETKAERGGATMVFRGVTDGPWMYEGRDK